MIWISELAGRAIGFFRCGLGVCRWCKRNERDYVLGANVTDLAASEKFPHVDVEMQYHMSSMGNTPYVRVVQEDGELSSTGYTFVLGLMDIPLETGRRYRLYVKELPESNPQPKQNPWRKGKGKERGEWA